MSFRTRVYLRLLITFAAAVVLTGLALNMTASAQDEPDAPLFVNTSQFVYAVYPFEDRHAALPIPGRPLNMRLSPDGATLLVDTQPSLESTERAFYAVDTATLDVTPLSLASQGGTMLGMPVWRSDSAALLYTHHGPRGAEVFEYTLTSGQTSIRASDVPVWGETGWIAGPPLVYETREAIALLHYNLSGTAELLVYDRDGTPMPRVPLLDTQDPSRDLPQFSQVVQVSWGRNWALAVQRVESGRWDVIDPLTGTIERLGPTQAVTFGPRFVSEPRFVVFTHPGAMYPATENIAALDNGMRSVLLPEAHTLMTVSPDGEYYTLADGDGFAVSDGERRIPVMLPEGSDMMIMTWQVAWAPLDTRIEAVGRIRLDSVDERVRRDSDRLLVLLDTPTGERPVDYTSDVRLAPDGESVVWVTRGANNEARVERYDWTTNEQTHLFAGDWTEAMPPLPVIVDYDGETVTLEDEDGLFTLDGGGNLMRLDDGETLTACTDGIPTRLSAGTSEDDRYARFIFDAAHATLYDAPDETAQPVNLVTPRDRLRLIAPRCADDGRTWWQVETPYGDIGWLPETTANGGYGLEPTGAVPLPDEADSSLHEALVSPDGTMLAIVRNRDDAASSADVVVIDAASLAARILYTQTGSGFLGSPVWRWDSRALLLPEFIEEQQHPRLVQLDLDTGALAVVSDSYPLMGDAAFVNLPDIVWWTPDGYAVLLYQLDGEAYLVGYTMDGNETRTLIGDASLPHACNFDLVRPLSDGERILVGVHYVSGEWYAIDPLTGEATETTIEMYMRAVPGIAPAMRIPVYPDPMAGDDCGDRQFPQPPILPAVDIVFPGEDGTERGNGLYARVDGELIDLGVEGFVTDSAYFWDGRSVHATSQTMQDDGIFTRVDRLYAVDHTTAAVTLLVEGEAGVLEGDLTLTADGRTVLFSAYSDETGAAVWRVPVDASAPPTMILDGLPFYADAGNFALPQFVWVGPVSFMLDVVIIRWNDDGTADDLSESRIYSLDGDLLGSHPKRP